MEKYHEENGMQRILRELSSLLEDTSIGTVSDPGHYYWTIKLPLKEILEKP